MNEVEVLSQNYKGFSTSRVRVKSPYLDPDDVDYGSTPGSKLATKGKLATKPSSTTRRVYLNVREMWFLIGGGKRKI
jgi:hypothetical protein